jgi:Protein-tyrosine-phosphatase
VLFVCTGNICRSPYAEFILRAALNEKGIPTDVDSAGTRAHTGEPASPRIVAALAARDIDASAFRSKPAVADVIASADLVLTAEVAHRATVIRRVPAVLPRVFTVRQFARLVPLAVGGAAAHPRGILELAAACAGARGTGGIVPPGEDDIEDPWNRSRFAYRRATKRIDEALRIIVAALG